MRKRYLFASALIFMLGPTLPAAAQTYFVAGQVHPQCRIEVAINGEVVKTVMPKPSTPKLFLTQIDNPLIAAGDNTLSVRYAIVSEAEGGSAPVPSFKVQIKRQTDIRDADSATRLVELRGPRKPYAAGGSGTLSETFRDQ